MGSNPITVKIDCIHEISKFLDTSSKQYAYPNRMSLVQLQPPV